MSIPATIFLLLLFIMVAFVYPWVMIAALFAAPVLKLGLTNYVPFFEKVDLTGLVCALAMIMGVWTYFRRARLHRPLMLPWAMLICMGVVAASLLYGLLWTTAPHYGQIKAVRFIGISIPFLLLPSFYVRSKEDGHRMILMIILVGVALSLTMVLFTGSALTEELRTRHWARRTTVMGTSPGVSAQFVAIGILALASAFLSKGSASRWLRYSAPILLPLGIAAILRSGSRGTLLGLLGVGAVLPFLSDKGERLKGVTLMLLLLPVALVAIFVAMAASGFSLEERWLDFVGGGEYGIESRSNYYRFVLANWWSQPVVGHGSGSFAVDWASVDEAHFPHNIILEALYETGLVGTIALLGFFYFTARTALRGLRQIPAGSPRDRLLIVAPIAMALLLFCRAMTSVDLEGMRYLYLCCGLIHANVSHLAYSRRESAQAAQGERTSQAYRAAPLSHGAT